MAKRSLTGLPYSCSRLGAPTYVTVADHHRVVDPSALPGPIGVDRDLAFHWAMQLP